MKRLDEIIDRINRFHGTETIILCSQQYTKKEQTMIEQEQSQTSLEPAGRKQALHNVKTEVFANVIKHDHRSPNPTTRWNDIIKLK